MNKIKKYIVTTLMALAMVMPIIQPLAVHAEEVSGQTVTVQSYRVLESDGKEYVQNYSFTINLNTGYELIAYRKELNGDKQIYLYLWEKSKNQFGEFLPAIHVKTAVSSFASHWNETKDGKVVSDIYNQEENLFHASYTNLRYGAGFNTTQASFVWSGMKMFDSKESAQAYVSSGSTSGLVEPPKTGLDKEWYLKNIGYSVRAEDGGENEEATFVKFTWDTDNLQDGDLIEIKTHNWYRTLTGSQYSGFHDYITYSNGVSAMNGSYEISQYDATNVWFKSLDNTPLVFKSFDTDTYYLRPYRNGVYGGWVRISMKRNPAIKGTPYVNNVEYGDFDEETGEFVIDSDRTQTEGGYGITQKGEPVVPDEYDGLNNVGTVITTAGDALKYFFSNITSIMGLFGQLPQLLNAVIGWLPSPLIVLICASVVVVIILRIFGR